jgi:uncharacterized protein involved in exopolysaccharide biosynthesis
MSDKQTQPAHALLDAWGTLKRYKWRFIVPAFVLSAAALSVSLFVPRVYRSDGSFERRHEVVVTDFDRSHTTGRTAHESRASVLNVLKNPASVERAIESIAPTLRAEGLVSSSAEISRIRFQAARQTSVNFELADSEREMVRVSFKADHPRVAQLVVDAMIAEYIDSQRRAHAEKIDESADFFRNEVQRHRTLIRGIESKLLNFEMEHARLLPDSPTSITDSMFDERKALEDAITDRNVAAARVGSLETALAAAPTHVETLVKTKNPEITRLEAERRTIVERINEYSDVLKMKERHPDLIAARAQLVKIDAAIDRAPAEVLAERQQIANPKRAELQLQLTEARGRADALTERAARLETRMAELRAESDRVYQVRGQYRGLQREAEEAQRQLAFWEDNLRNAELTLTAKAGNMGVRLAVVQPATRPVLPISPDLGQVVVIALLLGMVGGGINVLIAHRNNDTFLDGERAAEAVNLHLFGCVNELVTDQHRRHRRLKNNVLYPLNAAAIVLVLGSLTAVLYADLRRPDLLEGWLGLSNAHASTDPIDADRDPATPRPAAADTPYVSPAYATPKASPTATPDASPAPERPGAVATAASRSLDRTPE